jgi:hypothetical protein
MDVGFPADGVRAVIAECLHAAVGTVLAPSFTHSGPINTIGCFLLRHLTGVNYLPVAGSIGIIGGGEPFGIEAHVENVQAHKYYVWIEADGGDHGVERVDFTSRYWSNWAAEQAVRWTAGPPPPFVWGPADTTGGGMARYTPHAEITRLVRAGIDQAIASRDTNASVAAWEAAINECIDRMMDTPASLQFLVEMDIAQPIDDEDECCA